MFIFLKESEVTLHFLVSLVPCKRIQPQSDAKQRESNHCVHSLTATKHAHDSIVCGSTKKIGKNKMLIKTMNALYRVQYRVADYTQFRYVMITAGILTGGTDSG